MNVSDLCASPYCADIARPGEDWCDGCLADRASIRAEYLFQVARLTEQQEARIAEQDEVVA